MKTALYLMTTLIFTSMTSECRTVFPCFICNPFPFKEEFKRLRKELEQQTSFEMNENDDAFEIVFKSADFKTTAPVGNNVKLTKKYSPLTVLKELCLKAKNFAVTIKPKHLKNGKTVVFVDLTESKNDQENKFYKMNHFQERSLVNGALNLGEVTAEANSAEGTLKLVIPKNGGLLPESIETIVPITDIPATVQGI